MHKCWPGQCERRLIPSLSGKMGPQRSQADEVSSRTNRLGSYSLDRVES